MVVADRSTQQTIPRWHKRYCRWRGARDCESLHSSGDWHPSGEFYTESRAPTGCCGSNAVDNLLVTEDAEEKLPEEMDECLVISGVVCPAVTLPFVCQ